MKCTKCGNELKDGVKFCSQCGEEIKEEKKMKYCTKCGAEIQPYASFCAKCGTNVNVVQEQGVFKKSKKQSGKYKKIFLIAGIAIIILLSIGGIMLNSDKAMYKAYVKFHEEYCEKNLNYEEYNDCAAKIIMSPENEKWLAIYDITSLIYDDGEIIEESVKDKISLYRYSWGKIKKVATFSKQLLAECDFVNFSVIDDKLYLFAGCDREVGSVNKDSSVKGIYYLNGDKFEAVKAKEEKDPDEEYSIYTIESGMGLWELMFLGYEYSYMIEEEKYKRQLCIVNDVRFTNVNEFAEVVDELSKYKIKTQTDIQIAYGKILKEFGIHPLIDEAYNKPLSSDYPVVGTMKTKYGYYYVRTSGNVALAYLEEKMDFYKAIKSADGRKVTGIECTEGTSKISENLKIPDNITYIGKQAFAGKEIESIEFPETLKKIGANAFLGCNLQQIEIPDSVEQIGEEAFSNRYGLLPVIIASEGSYAQQYAEKNNLDWSEKKLSEKELEERKLIGEALDAYQEYINNYEAEYEDERYRGVTLGYVNDDNIPECFVWRTFPNQSKSVGLTVLSYMDGELTINTDFYSAYSLEDFTYTPKSGKICVSTWANGAGAVYMVYELTDKFETIAEVYDFMAALEKEQEYTVNGEDYGSHEAIEEYISSLGLKDYFSEDDICEYISDAYDNLEKVN